MFSASIVTLDERAAFIELLARRNHGGLHGLAGKASASAPGTVTVRGGLIVKRTPLAIVAPDPVGIDLLALATAFGERLRQVGVIAVTPEQSEAYALALRTDMPRSRRSLYYLTRETFVTDDAQVEAFNAAFAETFGMPVGTDRHREQTPTLTAAS